MVELMEEPPRTRRGHVCAVPGCTTVLSPTRLMCDAHWLLVPREIRRQLLDEYEPGTPVPDQMGHGWLRAVRAAIDAVQAARVADRLTAGKR
jgi:hypothetical protein